MEINDELWGEDANTLAAGERAGDDDIGDEQGLSYNKRKQNIVIMSRKIWEPQENCVIYVTCP